ncbi:hypothetical protein Taro_031104 [Colocasia esculenta]|uniref:Uncharacterized protein n=1 Tax=Colocasia esculenta TaxID=4460 RepID=A0A843VI07_COLES|nr:hypothetical protein [Colocasia esculenta]
MAEFLRQGLFERKGDVSCATLCLMFMLFSTVVYRSSALHKKRLGPPPLREGHGVPLDTVGWIGHDSGHYTVMRMPTLNRFVQVVSGNSLTSISIAHNAHHIACMQQPGHRP